MRAEGISVDPKRDTYDFGRFGWLTDREGNRIELWQPSAESETGTIPASSSSTPHLLDGYRSVET